MAVIPPNNTPVWFLDYTTCSYQHTVQLRSDEDATEGDVIENLSAFLEIVGAFCYPATVDGFRKREANGNVTNDVAWTGITSWGSGTPVPAYTANFYDFVGRGNDGHRVKISVFGAGLVTSGGDYRITDSEASWVGDALASLVSDANVFLTVTYRQPVWKQYVNCGPNAYWRNKVR